MAPPGTALQAAGGAHPAEGDVASLPLGGEATLGSLRGARATNIGLCTNLYINKVSEIYPRSILD